MAGQPFIASVLITAPHRGHFEFALCPLDNLDIETERCFQEHPVLTVDGMTKWFLPTNEPTTFDIVLVLPDNIVCERCSLRWHWQVGNNWGWCDNTKTHGELGCGTQEIFRTCSDIKIVK